MFFLIIVSFVAGWFTHANKDTIKNFVLDSLKSKPKDD